jgi:hypothetical protein
MLKFNHHPTIKSSYMKKIVLALVLALSASAVSQKRITFNVPSMAKPAVEYRTGPWMMFGGACLSTAGLVSYTVHKGGSTTQKGDLIRQQRLLPIISGVAVFSVGVVYTIKGR